MMFIIVAQMLLIMLLIISAPVNQESIKRLKMENEMLKKKHERPL